MRQYYKRKITHHHLKFVLEHYGLTYEISKQLSNSQNAIYLINGKYVMKFVLYEYRKENDILSQIAYESYLSDYVPIPKTLKTLDGAVFVKVSIKDVQFIVLLQHYVKGRHVYRKDDTFNAVFIEKLGETIGKIHRASRTYIDTFHRFHFDEDASLKHIQWMSDILGNDAVERYQNILKKVHKIPKLENLYHLTHYDLHHFNVLQKNDQLYVLDFDDMTIGYVFMDIITAFDAVLDIYSYQHKHYISKAIAFLSPLLQGYQSVYDNLESLSTYFHTLLMYRMFLLIIFIGNEFDHKPEIVKEIKSIYDETFMPEHVIQQIFEQIHIKKDS